MRRGAALLGTITIFIITLLAAAACEFVYILLSGATLKNHTVFQYVFGILLSFICSWGAFTNSDIHVAERQCRCHTAAALFFSRSFCPVLDNKSRAYIAAQRHPSEAGQAASDISD